MRSDQQPMSKLQIFTISFVIGCWIQWEDNFLYSCQRAMRRITSVSFYNSVHKFISINVSMYAQSVISIRIKHFIISCYLWFLFPIYYINQNYFQIASLTCFVTSSSYKTAADYVYISESSENWEELGKIIERKMIG